MSAVRDVELITAKVTEFLEHPARAASAVDGFATCEGCEGAVGAECACGGVGVVSVGMQHLVQLRVVARQSGSWPAVMNAAGLLGRRAQQLIERDGRVTVKSVEVTAVREDVHPDDVVTVELLPWVGA